MGVGMRTRIILVFTRTNLSKSAAQDREDREIITEGNLRERITPTGFKDEYYALLLRDSKGKRSEILQD